MIKLFMLNKLKFILYHMRQIARQNLLQTLLYFCIIFVHIGLASYLFVYTSKYSILISYLSRKVCRQLLRIMCDLYAIYYLQFVQKHFVRQLIISIQADANIEAGSIINQVKRMNGVLNHILQDFVKLFILLFEMCILLYWNQCSLSSFIIIMSGQYVLFRYQKYLFTQQQKLHVTASDNLYNLLTTQCTFISNVRCNQVFFTEVDERVYQESSTFLTKEITKKIFNSQVIFNLCITVCLLYDSPYAFVLDNMSDMYANVQNVLIRLILLNDFEIPIVHISVPNKQINCIINYTVQYLSEDYTIQDDLCIEKGKALHLKGCNGSGKTTICKIIAGELDSKSTIKFDDKLMTTQQLRFSVMYFGHNVYFSSRMLPMLTNIAPQFQYLLKKTHLSFGEKNFLGLCYIIMHHNISCFVLDETFNSMDINKIDYIINLSLHKFLLFVCDKVDSDRIACTQKKILNRHLQLN